MGRPVSLAYPGSCVHVGLQVFLEQGHTWVPAMLGFPGIRETLARNMRPPYRVVLRSSGRSLLYGPKCDHFAHQPEFVTVWARSRDESRFRPQAAISVPRRPVPQTGCGADPDSCPPGDVMKLGRFKFRVRQLVASSSGDQRPRHLRRVSKSKHWGRLLWSRLSYLTV
jgi:hypothetical protein